MVISPSESLRRLRQALCLYYGRFVCISCYSPVRSVREWNNHSVVIIVMINNE